MLYDWGTQTGALYQPRGMGWEGDGWEVQREGTYVYLWLIHVDVWQETAKFCKEIILQLKNKLINKKSSSVQLLHSLCHLYRKYLLNNYFMLKLTLARWKKSYDKPRECITKQRNHLADKGPYSQSFGFSSSHVWMWELDHKEGWAPKNWCFQIVVLGKTIERLLDS